MQAYFPELSKSMGVFIPLIVVNCIIMGRVEAFSYKQKVLDCIADSFGMGLGYTWVLVGDRDHPRDPGQWNLRGHPGHAGFLPAHSLLHAFSRAASSSSPSSSPSTSGSRSGWIAPGRHLAKAKAETTKGGRGMIKIFIIALLINNVVLMRYIALCSYIGMTSDVGQSIGMGFAVTFVTVLATAATWPHLQPSSSCPST